MLAEINLESQLNNETINNLDKNYKCKRYFIDLINVMLPVACYMGIFATLIIVCFKIYKV